MDYIHDKKRKFLRIISLPIIWSVLISIIIFDLWVEIYHRICFPLYGLKYIKRRNYIRIDRHKLSYLKWQEKIGCIYCGYANGVIGYWVKIAGVTEQYWCGIMHRNGGGFISPNHHKNFTRYANEKEFLKRYK